MVPKEAESPFIDDTRGAAASGARPQSRGPDPLVGRVINDRYEILSTIAHGGMGKVYRAEQAPLGRRVALKVLSARYSGDGSDPEFHKRFFLEASIASKLTHPNTVTIFDYGKTDDDIFYIAMELLEGRTLHRELRDQRTLSAERTIHIAAQICRALREAHGLGVIHRDLKPANVYLVKHGDENDFVKVLDFGLVKNLDEKSEQLTQVGLFMGSPKYMAPEQIRGETVSPRVDIYALGVMMMEMLTGKVPFDSANSVNILMAHVHEPIPQSSTLNPAVHVPEQLERVVRRCMAKSAEERFGSMDELLTALKQCSSGGIAATGEFQIPAALRASITAEQLAQARQDPLPRADQPAPFAGARTQRSAAPWIVASAVFGLGLVGLLAFGGTGEPRSAEASPPASQVAVAEAARAAPEVVLISLLSTPPGAMVVVGDREVGPTPTQIELHGEEAAQGREVTFRFRRTGYRAVTVTRALRGPSLEVEATFRDLASRDRRGAD